MVAWPRSPKAVPEASATLQPLHCGPRCRAIGGWPHYRSEATAAQAAGAGARGPGLCPLGLLGPPKGPTRATSVCRLKPAAPTQSRTRRPAAGAGWLFGGGTTAASGRSATVVDIRSHRALARNAARAGAGGEISIYDSCGVGDIGLEAGASALCFCLASRSRCKCPSGNSMPGLSGSLSIWTSAQGGQNSAAWHRSPWVRSEPATDFQSGDL
jgi:hypothetical protein